MSNVFLFVVEMNVDFDEPVFSMFSVVLIIKLVFNLSEVEVLSLVINVDNCSVPLLIFSEVELLNKDITAVVGENTSGDSLLKIIPVFFFKVVDNNNVSLFIFVLTNDVFLVKIKLDDFVFKVYSVVIPEVACNVLFDESKIILLWLKDIFIVDNDWTNFDEPFLSLVLILVPLPNETDIDILDVVPFVIFNGFSKNICNGLTEVISVFDVNTERLDVVWDLRMLNVVSCLSSVTIIAFDSGEDVYDIVETVLFTLNGFSGVIFLVEKEEET